MIEPQLQSLGKLDQAFFKLENKILVNQKGLGKRVILVNFLQNLKFTHRVSGQFLVITTKEKLSHWKYLLDTWTDLQSLVYDDSDKNGGMENLRLWCLYHLDVTIKGRITNRNQLYRFDVLITTVDHINNQADTFIRKVPFMQVIVDQAELKSHRAATTKIACKRIICSTSNPMPKNIVEIIDLVDCVDPFTVD